MKKVDPIKMITKSEKAVSNTRLIIISGPTASGKTDLAIELANYLQTDIVSFDSRQFYSELNIGTAKPSLAQLNKAKHHFIGNKSIHEDYNAELFSQESRSLIQELSTEKENLVLVGGSGLYLNSLLYTFDKMPEVNKEHRSQLNQLFELEGLSALQSLLLEKDPEYYKIVDLNNPQRIIRALEVCLSSEKPYSSFRTGAKQTIPFKIIKFCIAPPISHLYKRIEDRVDQMVEQGLIDEAHRVYPFRELNPLKTVGYSELFDYFDHFIGKEEAISLIKQHTRNFAKRQLTWFRKDSENIWLENNQIKPILEIL